MRQGCENTGWGAGVPSNERREEAHGLRTPTPGTPRKRPCLGSKRVETPLGTGRGGRGRRAPGTLRRQRRRRTAVPVSAPCPFPRRLALPWAPSPPPPDWPGRCRGPAGSAGGEGWCRVTLRGAQCPGRPERPRQRREASASLPVPRPRVATEALVPGLLRVPLAWRAGLAASCACGFCTRGASGLRSGTQAPHRDACAEAAAPPGENRRRAQVTLPAPHLLPRAAPRCAPASPPPGR